MDERTKQFVPLPLSASLVVELCAMNIHASYISQSCMLFVSTLHAFHLMRNYTHEKNYADDDDDGDGEDDHRYRLPTSFVAVVYNVAKRD